jgi:hypothetical protein
MHTQTRTHAPHTCTDADTQTRTRANACVRITSHHITSHHITSHHIASHHITSHRITSHHITSLSVCVACVSPALTLSHSLSLSLSLSLSPSQAMNAFAAYRHRVRHRQLCARIRADRARCGRVVDARLAAARGAAPSPSTRSATRSSSRSVRDSLPLAALSHVPRACADAVCGALLVFASFVHWLLWRVRVPWALPALSDDELELLGVSRSFVRHVQAHCRRVGRRGGAAARRDHECGGAAGGRWPRHERSDADQRRLRAKVGVAPRAARRKRVAVRRRDDARVAHVAAFQAVLHDARHAPRCSGARKRCAASRRVASCCVVSCRARVT